ncbi:glycosyltransferase family 4 protein [Thalassotalea sp. M1531]|uniref:Glycosyltransferase family 4 protein n=1 Tax=Thalassotalea algicola TaxID=2716224 RepID=A0A7Y0Q8F9_9GAMM|nr:glycosyltransferase family 4 protein [Thalassotalea algicola]NMP32105.1 glycosyltransferase family 4 protein [Thalassotalea algicola]
MSNSPLHIVLLLDSRCFGGIETHVVNLARGFEQQGHSITIVLFNDYGEHPVFDGEQSKDLSVCKLDGSLRSLYKMLKYIPTDVVHTHGYKAGVLGRLVCKYLKIAVVSTFHAGEKGSVKMQCYRWLDKFTAKWSHCISVSAEISSKLGHPCKVIQNFVMPTFHANGMFSPNQIAFVGRLSHEKGPDYFLQVAKAIPSCDFVMYGDGPLFELVDESKPQNLTLMGQVDSMVPHWRHIKVLCITSRAEGLPLVALEAMTRGIPVIAFNVGGLSTLIQHNVNGWLIPECKPQLFIETLHQVLQFKRSRFDLLAQNARKIIKDKFSSHAVIPQIYAVYIQAMSGLNNVKS